MSGVLNPVVIFHIWETSPIFCRRLLVPPSRSVYNNREIVGKIDGTEEAAVCLPN